MALTGSLGGKKIHCPEVQKGSVSTKETERIYVILKQDEMVGWYHGLNGHEFEQAPGDGEGQGSLAKHD